MEVLRSIGFVAKINKLVFIGLYVVPFRPYNGFLQIKLHFGTDFIGIYFTEYRCIVSKLPMLHFCGNALEVVCKDDGKDWSEDRSLRNITFDMSGS